MIGYLIGVVKFIFEDNIILDVGGVGYKIFIDVNTLSELQLGAPKELFIYTSVREDAINLYGFKDQADYELFLQLITVSGVGTRTAQNMLSRISAKKLALAIYRQDVKVLEKLPGVGKKAVQRLVLELKDKIPKALISEEHNSFLEAEEALLALGYTNSEISEVFKRAEKFMSTEEIVKLALKELNRF